MVTAQNGCIDVERARTRIAEMLGDLEDWGRLDALVIEQIRDRKKRRTTMASMFGAALEYVATGGWKFSRPRTWKFWSGVHGQKIGDNKCDAWGG